LHGEVATHAASAAVRLPVATLFDDNTSLSLATAHSASAMVVVME
jgi:hypothetical protein